jgi:L-fuculose-phosphate aldolase
MEKGQMFEDIPGIKREIAYFMRRLYRQGLTTTSGGNISAISRDGLILMTPSATDKGRMRASEIVVMERSGKIVDGALPTTIESGMHMAIYRERTDVAAIVHAHPVTASAFSASSLPIRTDLIAESYAVVGKIGYADYRMMGGKPLAELVASAARNSDCVIMKNHGVIATGKNLLQAFDRLEVLEVAAKMTMIHEGALKGKTSALSQEEMSELDRYRLEAGSARNPKE